MSILYQSVKHVVLCLRLATASSSENDLRAGKVNSSAVFYEGFDWAMKSLMSTVFQLAWTSSFWAFFFNPYWFVGIQVANLLLYYDGVYLINHPSHSGMGLEYDGSFSKASPELKKKQAQVRFIFAFVGYFGVDQIFSGLRDMVDDWLFTKPKPVKNNSELVRAKTIKGKIANLFIHTLVPNSFLLARRFLLTALLTFDHLAWVIHKLGIGWICRPLLQTGAAVAMHVMVAHACATIWYFNAPSVAAYCLLGVSTLCLVNFYRLLSPQLSDYVFRASSVSSLLTPLFITDPREIYSAVSSAVSILPNISSRFGRTLLHCISYLFNSSAENNSIYRWCTNQGVGTIKYLISFVFSREKLDQITKELSKESAFGLAPEKNYHTWSDMFLSWQQQTHHLTNEKKFQLVADTSIPASENLDHVTPTEQFITRVWQPHLNRYLKMQDIYIHSDPFAAPRPVDSVTQASVNVMGYDPQDRLLTCTLNGSELKDALRWNRLKYKAATENSSTQAPGSSWWQRIMRWIKPTESEISVNEFFLKHVRPAQTQKLLKRDSDESYREVFESSSDDNRTTLSRLDTYLKSSYKTARAKAACQNLDTLTRLETLLTDVQSILSDRVRGYTKQSDKEKTFTVKAVTESMLLILETVHKCTRAFIGSLTDIKNDYARQDLRPLEHAFVDAQQYNNVISGQSLAFKMNQQYYTKRVLELMSPPNAPEGYSQWMEDMNSRMTQNYQGPFFDRCLDSYGFLPTTILSPGYMIWINLMQYSDFFSKLPPNDRHLDTISSALTGADIQSCMESTIERSQLGLTMPFLPAFNLTNYQDTKPFGFQFNDSFYNIESTHQVLTPNFFIAGSDNCGFYRELLSFLEHFGYLDESDLYESDFNSSNPSSLSALDKKLYTLIDSQTAIAKSPLRVLAIYNYFVNEYAATMGDFGIEKPLWQHIAQTIHALDYSDDLSLTLSGYLLNARIVDTPNHIKLEVNIGGLKEMINQSLHHLCHEYLKDPIGQMGRLLGCIHDLDKRSSEMVHRSNSTNPQESAYKMRCFFHEDNLDVLLFADHLKNLQYSMPFEQTAWESDAKDYLTFLIQNDMIYTRKTHTLDHGKDRLMRMWADQNNDFAKNAVHLLHNKITMPMTLTLLLDQGILYRGAEVGDKHRSAVYHSIADMNNAVKPSAQIKPSPRPTRWQTFKSYTWAALLFSKKACREVIPTLGRELAVLCVMIVKHACILPIAVVSTCLYHLPYGFIVREQYLSKLLYLPFRMAYYVTPRLIQRWVVDPIYRGISQLLMGTQHRLQLVVRFVANQANKLAGFCLACLSKVVNIVYQYLSRMLQLTQPLFGRNWYTVSKLSDPQRVSAFKQPTGSRGKHRSERSSWLLNWFASRRSQNETAMHHLI